MRPAAGRAAVKLARMPTALSRRQLIGLVVLTLMWGLNWPVMKLSLREIGPLHFRALTMALGAVGLALFFRARGLRLLPRAPASGATCWCWACPTCWAGTGCRSSG